MEEVNIYEVFNEQDLKLQDELKKLLNDVDDTIWDSMDSIRNLIETTQITGGKYLPPEATIRAALNQGKYDGIGRYMNDKRAKKELLLKNIDQILALLKSLPFRLKDFLLSKATLEIYAELWLESKRKAGKKMEQKAAAQDQRRFDRLKKQRKAMRDSAKELKDRLNRRTLRSQP